MTYLKTLIALTTLALITACAGGVTVNPTIVNNGPTAEICTANPFTIGCLVTQTQQAEFCRDNARITDTKTADCADTVIRVCGEDVFDGLCIPPTEPQAETFCRDTSKTPDNKATNCAPTVMRVCDDNPYDAGLCIDNNEYTNARQLIRLTCNNTDDNLRDALCPMAVATECTENPFLDICRFGTAGITDGEYDLARKSQIATTCPNNVHDEICHNVEPYETTRQRILSNCEANVDGDNACPADVIVQVCTGNPWNDILCRDPAIDYSTQRTERLEACKGTNTLDGCVAAAATTCPANPFQTGICFIDTTYMSDRVAQTQNCRNKITGALNCEFAETVACALDKFDLICKGVELFIEAQIDECADATATKNQCDTVFDVALARCLEDPFSVACDTEATFMDSKVAVRTSRYNFCEADLTSDARCTGYTTCNTSTTFAPLTCGADFNPVRMMFCGVATNAFDPLCVDNGLIDAAAQLAYCKLDSTDAFDVNGVCNGSEFKEARVAFCVATPATKVCNDDDRGEGLMKAPVPADPCAGGVCVDLADLSTHPTTPAENDPVGTAFASGFLRVTLNPLAEGTPLL
ncbi:MAG: hypothetical protein K8953_13445, partial [Proteobacteria bacterium]|nr:hypothetical protein [Pseudomonadota bacterium]